ncbi:hypothetical protein HAX54_051999, partial [Datura stramonium]|nr:hypothetical protein [Datura stramonium]
EELGKCSIVELLPKAVPLQRKPFRCGEQRSSDRCSKWPNPMSRPVVSLSGAFVYQMFLKAPTNTNRVSQNVGCEWDTVKGRNLAILFYLECDQSVDHGRLTMAADAQWML